LEDEMVDGLSPLSGGIPRTVAGDVPAGSAAAPTAPWTPPSTPPAGLGPELDAAARAAADLADRGGRLRFERSDGHVRIEVLDGHGNVVREIPPASLLETLASGSAARLLAPR
jgi:hypothetical protein